MRTVARCHQMMWRSSVAGPGRRGGYGTRLGGRCGSAGYVVVARTGPAQPPFHDGVAAILHRRFAARAMFGCDRAGRGWPVYLPQIHLARIPRRCLRHGVTGGTGCRSPRRALSRLLPGCRIMATGYQTGRRAGCRLCRQHAMQQYQPIPEDLPDCGWRRPSPQHDRNDCSRSPARMGGDYQAHLDLTALTGDGESPCRKPPRSPTLRPRRWWWLTTGRTAGHPQTHRPQHRRAAAPPGRGHPAGRRRPPHPGEPARLQRGADPRHVHPGKHRPDNGDANGQVQAAGRAPPDPRCRVQP